MKGPSPLLGYNTNVRHKGKLYHIQTEDSGLKHPHIITHLFADGGRIIASKKTNYTEHVSAADYKAIVKKLMQDQHKGLFIALRDGVYDEEDPAELNAAGAEALEQAAEPINKHKPIPSESPGYYQSTRPAVPEIDTSESIFGGNILSEKSLDEVILSYLAEDLEEAQDE